MGQKWRPITNKRLEKELEKIGKSIEGGFLVPCISLKEDNFCINWEEIVKLSNNGDNFASGILVNLEVLNYVSKGNYAVILNDKNVNPYLPHAFFKEKEDAEAYKKAIIFDVVNHVEDYPEFLKSLANFGIDKSKFGECYFNTHRIHIVQYVD
jgi:hypothetical protein